MFLCLEFCYVLDGWLGIIVGICFYFDFILLCDYDYVMINFFWEFGLWGRLCDIVDSGRGRVI